jgi:hypothetical protein
MAGTTRARTTSATEDTSTTSTDRPTDQDRLALGEADCRLAHLDRELAELRDGTAFPAMAAQRRAEKVHELEAELEGWQVRHSELRRAVPDPDQVEAADGSTPPQRREQHLQLYLQQRRQRRTDLQTKLTYLASVAQDKAAPGEVRRRARDARSRAELDLQVLDGEPGDGDLQVQDLCPDAVHLVARHGYVHTASSPAWPFPAWPGQQRIWRQVGQLLDRIAETRQDWDLTRWELTLHCGHLVQRTAHRSYLTYAAAGGFDRTCEVCGVDPSFVVAERSLGPAGEPPAPPPPPGLSAAERTRMTRRMKRLETELAELRHRLQEPP